MGEECLVIPCLSRFSLLTSTTHSPEFNALQHSSSFRRVFLLPSLTPLQPPSPLTCQVLCITLFRQYLDGVQLYAELPAVLDRGQKQVEAFPFDSSPTILGDALAHALDMNLRPEGDHAGVHRDRAAGRGDSARGGLAGRCAWAPQVCIRAHGEGAEVAGCEFVRRRLLARGEREGSRGLGTHELFPDGKGMRALVSG